MISRVDFKRKVKALKRFDDLPRDYMFHYSGGYLYVVNRQVYYRDNFTRSHPTTKMMLSDFVYFRDRNSLDTTGYVLKDRDGIFKDVMGPNPTSSPFKIGDLITGDDRSYARSIYRFEGYADGKAMVKFIAYDGQVGKVSDPVMQWPISELAGRHVATPDEICEACIGGKPKLVAYDTETGGLDGKMTVSSHVVDGNPHQKNPCAEIELPGYVGDARGMIQVVGDVDEAAVTKIREEWHKTLAAAKEFKAPTFLNIQDAPPKCDCGAAKCGSNKHSSWCSTNEEMPS